VLPLERLDELVAEGLPGRSADTHYSYMGYILDAQELLQTSVPQMIAGLQDKEVDTVILLPV